MTPNPLARGRRFGQAVVDLRDKLGWSHAELSRRSGVSASVISRMEHPFGDINRKPNLRLVRKVLDALGVERGSTQYTEIERYAEQAADGGWWDAPRYSRMGDGQQQFAILEAGASRVDEYAGLLLPGLVQTEEYARHRVLAAAADPADTDPADTDAIVAGRIERQRLITEHGADYCLVLEEQAVRRRPVPAPVMLDQLRHLLALMDRPTVSVRIVPVDADLEDGYAPRAPYGHMTYPDPDDPTIVIVDNVTRALLVTDADEVKGYAQLHQRLRDAALSDADSAAIIRTATDGLAASI